MLSLSTQDEIVFTGMLCEVDINECNSLPCRNGGTCTDIVNGYICTCPPGYTDDQCMSNEDECLSNPCINGGRCKDGVNR